VVQGGAGGAAGATAGAAAGAGGATPGPCGALVCDDFEAYPAGQVPDKTVWTSQTMSGAAISIDDTKARAGKKSVKIVVAGGDGGVGMIGRSDRSIFPAKDQVYARMMVWLQNAPSGSGHWVWMQTRGPLATETNNAANFGVYGTGAHPAQLQSTFIAQSNDNPLAADCWDYSSRAVPTGKWTCVEWHLDAAKNAQEVWYDGQAVPELTFTSEPGGSHGCLGNVTGGKWPIQQLIAMNFGWTHYHQLSGTTLWIDDVAIDTKRIGCPK
jgi:hypothetical protein